MKVDELSAKMEALNTELESLADKLDAETDAGKKAAIEADIKAKTAEFEKLEGRLEQVQAAAKRAKAAKAAKELSTVDSKRGQLDDGPDADLVPDRQSAHNARLHQKKLDDAALAYLTDDSMHSVDVTSKWSGELTEALRPEGKDRKGFRPPSYIKSYMMNRLDGRSHQALRDCVFGKTEYTVLTTDASGSQSGGASIVPDTFIPELYRKPQVISRLVDRCWVKRAIRGAALFPRLSQGTNRFGVAASWGTEGTAQSTSNPVFNQKSVSTGLLGLTTYISRRELRVNGVGVEAELGWMFRGAWDSELTKAILRGNAANSRPTGINTNTAIAAGVVVLARQTASQVVYKDLVGLQFAVEAAIFENGLFVLKSGNTGAMKYIATIVDTPGRPILKHSDTGFTDRQGPALVGSPFLVTPDNEIALGGRGDVVYGDFMNYGVAVDEDITIERSDEYKFAEGLATYKVESYVGGYPIGESCFAVLGDVSGASSSSSSSSSSST